MVTTVSRPPGFPGISVALEVALALFLLVLPMPFGATRAGGLLFLETGSFVLLLLWLADSLAGPIRLGSRLAATGAVGLLLLATLQIVPLPDALVKTVSPESARIRAETRPPVEILAAEQGLFDSEPAAGRHLPTLSLVPEATASALRTGVALVALLIVGATVAARRGVGRLALVLLLSGACQGLYGVLVLASGHDRIWDLPKQYALDSATGTFINPNHFASYLALVLPCGLALALRNAKRTFLSPERGRRWLSIGGEGGRDILLILLLGCGVGGLLTSNSRAGIALCLMALFVTALTGGRRGARSRLALVVLLAVVAVLPLMHLGADQLVESYLDAGKEIQTESGRFAVWIDTIRLAGAFPVTGSGLGTFGSVYPLYRSGEVRRFYRHAHQDFLQMAAEGGLIGVVCLILLAVPVLVGAGRGLANLQGPLANGFAAGLGAVLLHSMIDFPFHIPAIAATAAVFAGALMVDKWTDPRSS